MNKQEIKTLTYKLKNDKIPSLTLGKQKKLINPNKQRENKL